MQLPENIKKLIEKYLDGSATDSEKAIVNKWYNSFSSEEVEVLLPNKLSEQLIEERLRNRLVQTIQFPEKKKKFWPKYAAAAAVVLALSLSAYLYTNITSQQKSIAKVTSLKQNNVIIPGGNKAMLTLADGSTITLDSAANGLLSQQGNIKVNKLKNGELVYVVNGKELTEKDEAFYNTISTPRGGQYQVTLADGSIVWLNAASSIRFPIVFTGKERKVEITGEAYFEVAPNKLKPFRVHTSSSTIEVLGTHFNVNSYQDEPLAKTTLLEGKVKVVTSNGNEQPIFLLPGQQAGIASNGIITVNKNADTEEAVAWRNGKFQFKSADLKSILRQIARWYDADVQYNGAVDLHFSGSIPRNESVKKVFEILAMTGEVNFKTVGKTIIVSR